MAVPRPSVGRLILVPALITLAITLLRLAGELLRWSPSLFNRAPGGPGALVGIVWLIPLFGIYFALRLARAGRSDSGPDTLRGPALAGKGAAKLGKAPPV